MEGEEGVGWVGWVGFLPLSDDCGLLFSSSSFYFFSSSFFSSPVALNVSSPDVGRLSRQPRGCPGQRRASFRPRPAPPARLLAPPLALHACQSVSSGSSFIRAEWPLREFLLLFECFWTLPPVTWGTVGGVTLKRDAGVSFPPGNAASFHAHALLMRQSPLCLHIYLLFLQECSPFNVNILQKDLYVY